MIIVKLLVAIMFVVSTLLIFDTRIIVRKFFINNDRNKTINILRYIGYVLFTISSLIILIYVFK